MALVDVLGDVGKGLQTFIPHAMDIVKTDRELAQREQIQARGREEWARINRESAEHAAGIRREEYDLQREHGKADLLEQRKYDEQQGAAKAAGEASAAEAEHISKLEIEDLRNQGKRDVAAINLAGKLLGQRGAGGTATQAVDLPDFETYWKNESANFAKMGIVEQAAHPAYDPETKTISMEKGFKNFQMIRDKKKLQLAKEAKEAATALVQQGQPQAGVDLAIKILQDILLGGEPLPNTGGQTQQQSEADLSPLDALQ